MEKSFYKNLGLGKNEKAHVLRVTGRGLDNLLRAGAIALLAHGSAMNLHKAGKHFFSQQEVHKSVTEWPKEPLPRFDLVMRDGGEYIQFPVQTKDGNRQDVQIRTFDFKKWIDETTARESAKADAEPRGAHEDNRVGRYAQPKLRKPER